MPTSDTGRRRRLTAGAALAGIALLLTGCGLGDDSAGKDEPAHDYTVDADANVTGSPIWEDAEDASMLRIGVPFDQPGLGYLSDGKTVPAGFNVEIGSLIAGRLGFAAHQITWVDSSTDPGSLITGDEPAADLLIDTDGQPIEGLDPAAEPDATASAPATPAPDATAPDAAAIPDDLAGPYHLGGQALLGPKASEATDFSDLTQQRVCALPGSPGQQAISEETSAEIVERDSLSDCAAAVSAKEADAIVGADLDLQALAAQDQQALTISTDRLRPAAYWIRMRTADPALATAIRDGIAAASDDGEWDHAVEAAFGSDVEMTAPPTP